MAWRDVWFADSPNRAAALAQYRRRARFYDLELALLEPVRRQAIALLALRPGDTVMDVGCGTGLSLPLLRGAVGDTGWVIGIEQSPPMFALAQARVAQAGWRNVVLVNTPVESLSTAIVKAALRASGTGAQAVKSPRASVTATAALFHFTHDILRSQAALNQVTQLLAPGARVVASGLKWAPLWAGPINLMVAAAAMHSVSSLQGLDKPWSELERLVGPMRVRKLLGDGVYLASGSLSGSARRVSTSGGVP